MHEASHKVWADRDVATGETNLATTLNVQSRGLRRFLLVLRRPRGWPFDLPLMWAAPLPVMMEPADSAMAEVVLLSELAATGGSSSRGGRAK